MRLLLAFVLLFSSAFDACYAVEAVVTQAIASSIEAEAHCRAGAAFSVDPCSSADHQSHKHGGRDTCQQCHSSHLWITGKSPTPALKSDATTRFAAYRFFVPQPFYKSLKRPPKAALAV